MSSRYSMVRPEQRLPQHAGKCALVVMAKVPRVGRVKTRLSPPLSAAEAAELNIAFLKDTLCCLQQVSDVTHSLPVVSYTPAGEEDGFIGIVPEQLPQVLQRGERFGERLQATPDDLFAAGFGSVCLIDSDSPTVPLAAYVEAVQRLQTGEDCAVLGASDDGGYYLLGTNRSHPRLFEEITWSTDMVAEQTRQRAREIKLPLYALPTWFDVDDRRTLTRLCDELIYAAGPPGFPAAHTRTAVPYTCTPRLLRSRMCCHEAALQRRPSCASDHQHRPARARIGLHPVLPRRRP